MAEDTKYSRRLYLPASFFIVLGVVVAMDWGHVARNPLSVNSALRDSPEPRATLNESSILSGEAERNLEYALETVSPTIRRIRPYWNELLFRSTGKVTPKVTVGHDRWLFLTAEFEGELIGREFGFSAETISVVRDRLREAGAELFVAVIPNKSRIYSDYLPASVRLTESQTSAYKRFIDELSSAGIRTLDLEDVFLRARREHPSENLYRPHDNHWTAQGIEVAARAVAGKIDAEGLLAEAPARAAYRAQFRKTVTEKTYFGALAQMLGLRPGSNISHSLEDRVAVASYEPTSKPPPELKSKVRIYGTSFAWDTEYLFGRDLSQALGCPVVSDRVHPGKALTIINDLVEVPGGPDNANVVIWEFPELFTPGAFFAAVDLDPTPRGQVIAKSTAVSGSIPLRIELPKSARPDFKDPTMLRISDNAESPIIFRFPRGIPPDGSLGLSFTLSSETAAEQRGGLRLDTGAGFREQESFRFRIVGGGREAKYVLPLRDLQPSGPKIRAVKLTPVLGEGTPEIRLRSLEIVELSVAPRGSR